MDVNWPLVVSNDGGIRPAGPPDECFYCQQKIGSPHGQECVMIQKRVRVRYTFELEVDVPHSWDSCEVEWYKENTCTNNLVGDLETYLGWLDGMGRCLCNDASSVTFIAIVDNTPQRELFKDKQLEANEIMRDINSKR